MPPPATGPATTFEQHPVLQLLAVLGRPYSISELLHVAQMLRLQDATGRAFTAKDVGNVLSQALQSKWVERVHGGHRCRRDYGFAAFKAAVLSGQLAAWCNSLMIHLRVLDGAGHVAPSFMWEAVRPVALRIAVYAGQERLTQQLRLPPGQEQVLELASSFDGYADAQLLDVLEPDLAQELAAQLLEHRLEIPEPDTTVLLDWALARGMGQAAALRLRLAVIQQLAWRARFEQAHALAGELGAPAHLLQALTVVMQGQYVQALVPFERAIAALPPGPDGKRGRLPLVSTWLRVAAMIACDDHRQLEAAGKICRSLAKGRGARWLWRSQELVIEARMGASRNAWFTIGGNNLLDDLSQAIAYAWLQQRPDTLGIQAIDAWIQICEHAGYAWPARELRACLACFARHSPAPSLAAAFQQEQSWQRALAALAALQDEPSSESAKTRIAWIVQLRPGGLVERIEPWEQTQTARGWNKGKKIALSTLMRDESLAPHDARVVRAARAALGGSYELDPHRALRALIGHGLVFFDEDWGTPVELTAAEPQLIVTHDAAGAQLSMQPNASQVLAACDIVQLQGAKAGDPCLVCRHAMHSAQVIVLSAAHRRIAKLLGNGMRIPPEGFDSLREALANASSHFNLQADSQLLAGDAAPGDATLRAELTPRGTGLRLQLVVRPFGLGGPRYTPGAGDARVFAKIDGRPRAALRDLPVESATLARLLMALERFVPDAQALQLDCGHPHECLELLEELQRRADLVQIDWPAGAKFQVSRTYELKDLQVSLSRQRDWFLADGTLQLDEGTVLELRRLLDAARDGHGRFVPLGDAGFVALSTELTRRISELALLDDAKQGAAKVPLAAAWALADVTQGARLQATTAWQQTLQRIEQARALQPEVPSTLQAQLRSYQVEGFHWMARLAHWGGGACLADDMGLGKTLQALTMLLSRAPQGPALVVAPTSVCQNWLDEARHFAPTLRAHGFIGTARTALLEAAGPFDVVVCSYTLLQQEIESFAARSWHSVVLDEAQAVKNFSTKRAQAVLTLEAGFRLAVTGTPVENRLEELWMVFRFLNPGLLGTRESFVQRFANPIERSNGAQMRAHLRRLVAPFILRRTKTEVLTELPARTEITLGVEPDAEEAAFHEALRQNAVAALADPGVPAQRKRFQVLAELMRVRRACCHPLLVDAQTRVASAKLKAFLELVVELIANRHKALVFSQFVDYLTLLRSQLDPMGIRYQYLDGSTPAAERTQRVQAFQSGEGDLFLISLRAGGVGLNLTAADYVIITDPWWNPAVEDQAASRAHRMGQARPVTVYRLVVKGSIEERIMQLHNEKRALAEGLFGGEEFGGAWSVEELLQLLRGQ